MINFIHCSVDVNRSFSFVAALYQWQFLFRYLSRIQTSHKDIKSVFQEVSSRYFAFKAKDKPSKASHGEKRKLVSKNTC